MDPIGAVGYGGEAVVMTLSTALLTRAGDNAQTLTHANHAHVSDAIAPGNCKNGRSVAQRNAEQILTRLYNVGNRAPAT